MTQLGSYFMDDVHAVAVDDLSNGHLAVAREARQHADFDTARMAYQKCAYVSSRLDSEETKIALKHELAGFAKTDPLYKDVLTAIKAVVAERPGIKQTELYACVSYNRETLSYVLYYAAELFDLYRKKAGRTYQIFPPGRLIDADVPQLPPGRPAL